MRSSKSMNLSMLNGLCQNTSLRIMFMGVSSCVPPCFLLLLYTDNFIFLLLLLLGCKNYFTLWIPNSSRWHIWCENDYRWRDYNVKQVRMEFRQFLILFYLHLEPLMMYPWTKDLFGKLYLGGPAQDLSQTQCSLRMTKIPVLPQQRPQVISPMETIHPRRVVNYNFSCFLGYAVTYI